MWHFLNRVINNLFAVWTWAESYFEPHKTPPRRFWPASHVAFVAVIWFTWYFSVSNPNKPNQRGQSNKSNKLHVGKKKPKLSWMGQDACNSRPKTRKKAVCKQAKPWKRRDLRWPDLLKTDFLWVGVCRRSKNVAFIFSSAFRALLALCCARPALFH